MSRYYLEFVALFFLVPLMFVMMGYVAEDEAYRWVGRLMMPTLLLFAIVTGAALVRDQSFDNKQLWRTTNLVHHLRPVIMRFAVLAPLMVLGMWWIQPDALFELPRRNPLIWIIVMCFYPMVSVVPQSIVWRAFLLHRYKALIGHEQFAVIVAALAFGFAHIVFRNWIAPAITFVGGLMFVTTYLKSRSLLPATIEHAMYGCWAFTVGYGRFLYGGNIPAPDAP